MISRRKLVTGVALGLLAGCGDPTAPFNPDVTNAVDSFQFQAALPKVVTRTLEWSWTTTGTTATVTQASSFAGGGGTLTIVDNDQHVVYDHDLTANGTYQTSAGTSGSWLIHVVLRDARGTVAFSVQKP